MAGDDGVRRRRGTSPGRSRPSALTLTSIHLPVCQCRSAAGQRADRGEREEYRTNDLSHSHLTSRSSHEPRLGGVARARIHRWPSNPPPRTESDTSASPRIARPGPRPRRPAPWVLRLARSSRRASTACGPDRRSCWWSPLWRRRATARSRRSPALAVPPGNPAGRRKLTVGGGDQQRTRGIGDQGDGHAPLIMLVADLSIQCRVPDVAGGEERRG